MCYGGFDRDSWLPRINSEHRDGVKKVTKAKTKAERSLLESSLGCRFSVLLNLPYFDAPRMLAIDPMHNLFLGTGKHMLQFWLDSDAIPKFCLPRVQTFVDEMVVPSDIGRIPHKIVSGFSGFTADQFKNWIILYSIPALYECLPHEHFVCWRNFVLACRILCKKHLSHEDVPLFDTFLLRFCQQLEQLCGANFITPNMHMHAHLRAVVEDYGPIFGFWLF